MLKIVGLREEEQWEDNFQEQRERAKPPAEAVM